MAKKEDGWVLVTGASRGIGLAVVKELLEAGHRVAASFNRAPGGLEDLDGRFPGRLRVERADFSRPEAGQALFDTVARDGPVDGLVNNAGIMLESPPSGPLAAWQRDWQTTLQVNLLAAADLCRALIVDHAARGGQRRIVNVSSRAAFRGDGVDAMAYAASKGGLSALTKSIARGYAKAGVYAFGVAPGWVDTDMAADALRPENRDRHLAEIPIGAVVPPGQVGAMVAFLLSGAVDHATGATFDLNGASYVR